MNQTLWPNIDGQSPPRGMVEMLYDAAAGVGSITGNKLDFHVDSVGIGRAGAIEKMRHNCYLRVIKNGYTHLLFQITCPVAIPPFPAKAATPEGDNYTDIRNENGLVDTIGKILARPRTTEILLFLVNTSP
jgi:hypothetical protein